MRASAAVGTQREPEERSGDEIDNCAAGGDEFGFVGTRPGDGGEGSGGCAGEHGDGSVAEAFVQHGRKHQCNDADGDDGESVVVCRVCGICHAEIMVAEDRGGGK